MGSVVTAAVDVCLVADKATINECSILARARNAFRNPNCEGKADVSLCV